MLRPDCIGLLLAAGLALRNVALAGHEFPFYPSFYPQEITVEALDPRSAAERLAKGTLHAYAGAVAVHDAAAKLAALDSLGAYVVASGGGCAARGLPLGEGRIRHPYPVTPFHADYLHHADRAEAARALAVTEPTDAQIETVEVAELMTKAAVRYNGWLGPPWIRQGWFHAYLLLAPSISDAARRARVEGAARRLMRGAHRSLRERISLERELVALLQAGCERVVLGYTLRREHYGTEFSGGVENVGYDALEGIATPIFPRTVKLRDFPWNGWLAVAAPAPPADRWNPLVGGFGDAFGRLVLSAVADPALFAAPHGGGWIENRVSAKVETAEKPIAVPEGALFSSGRGRTASVRVVYRVRSSAFHDGTAMSVADLMYAYAFAAAWGAGDAADPAIARATALARERLRGVRVRSVETKTLAFGEDKLVYRVPVVEVYLDGAPGDAAAVAPPWSSLPWHLLALYEEGARRRHFRLSELDPVRDATAVRRLGELARELEQRAYVPPALVSLVDVQEARARYRRLREFHAAHGHWLVTNGPYRLERWDGAKAVLGVFRDPSYPVGLGSFNAHAVPLKAYVTQIEPQARGALVHTESEWLERLGREVRVVRGPLAERPAGRLAGAGAPVLPVCRYLLLGPDGTVADAGEVRADAQGRCRLALGQAGRRPGARLALAAVLEHAAANAPVKIVQWED